MTVVLKGLSQKINILKTITTVVVLYEPTLSALGFTETLSIKITISNPVTNNNYKTECKQEWVLFLFVYSCQDKAKHEMSQPLVFSSYKSSTCSIINYKHERDTILEPSLSKFIRQSHRKNAPQMRQETNLYCHGNADKETGRRLNKVSHCCFS